MKCVILGGTGFIGRHLTQNFLQNGVEVVVLSTCQSGCHFETNERLEVIKGDIKDVATYEHLLLDADYVFHLISTTKPSNLDVFKDLSENVVPTLKLLDILKESKNLQRLVFISSGGTVYGLPGILPIQEKHQLNPISSYGVQKATIEHYLYYYRYYYGLPYTILRLSNPYGEGQNPNSGQGVIANFLKKAVKKEKIEIWGDGTVTRDFIYITDVIEAVKACMAYTGEENIFNIGSGKGTSVLEILDLIKRQFSYRLDIEHFPARRQDVPVNVLDISLARKELGWEPTVSLEDGIDCMTTFFKRNQ